MSPGTGADWTPSATRVRDRQLRRIRWQVDRVTDVELADGFNATIDELVDLVELRRRELAA